MRNVSAQDKAFYGGLCGLNIVLLAIECWLIWISPFWIVGVLILTVGALVDLILVFGCQNDSMTIGWHIFMAIACGICSTLGMGSYTGTWCAKYGMYKFCKYMIAATVIGVVITIVEIVLVQIGKRAGFSPCYCCGCCDSAPMVQPAVYPVYPTQTVITMPAVQTMPNIQGVQVAAPVQPAVQTVPTNMNPLSVQRENSLPTYDSIQKK